MKTIIKLFSIPFLLIPLYINQLAAQNNNSPASRGAVFMIDDYYFETFYNHYDYIQSTGLKMTYFVTYFPRDVYTPHKYTLLNIFDADNHEVGFHGSYHIKATDYLNINTIQAYFSREIYPGLMLMTAEGYDVSDFSYPYGSSNTNLRTSLFDFFYFQKLGSTKLYLYNFNEPREIVSPVPTDENYNITDSQIFNYIDQAYNENKIITFYGHKLSDAKVTFSRFQAMFDTLKAKQFHFYRLDDLQDTTLQKNILDIKYPVTDDLKF